MVCTPGYAPYTMGASVYTWTVCYKVTACSPLYPFECVIWQVIVSLKAKLKQLIIFVIVAFH